MDVPFVFGKIAGDVDFTNREEETQQLISNFTTGVNTTLISPRRWGKTSLVLKAANDACKKNKHLRCCFIDLFNVRSEEQFYQLLAQEVIKATSSKLEERIDHTRRFMSQFIPRLSYSTDPQNDFSIGLEWKEVQKSPNDILNLAEHIAKEKKIRIVICIDEFQNIGVFDDALAFQKKLRANWQKHQAVSYCLYGSKRHMMLEVFASSSMPFYKFGDILFLQKIEDKAWVPFLMKRFADTGKKISQEQALMITGLVDRHPYYVQQLAQQVWLRTKKVCNATIVEESFNSLLLQLGLLFQSLTDQLTVSQINFLKALADNTQRMTTKSALDRYQLGASANVARAKQGLISKEVIDDDGKIISFLDPVYRHWLARYYFV